MPNPECLGGPKCGDPVDWTERLVVHNATGAYLRKECNGVPVYVWRTKTELADVVDVALLAMVAEAAKQALASNEPTWASKMDRLLTDLFGRKVR